ncbi:MAG: pseudouridine-5'-phosphate glycosidase [bacterium]
MMHEARMANGGSGGRVALETTLLLHGVPRERAMGLYTELCDVVRQQGAEPCLCGVVRGRMTASMTEADLAGLLAEPSVPKLNTASLGVALHRGRSGASTVSTTMEIAAAAGIRVFATGGLGGVHKGVTGGGRLDISADLAAFTRFPVAVVTAGCKSILDVINTRELLETLGVPVVGLRTDRFPAFYMRDGGIGVDERFESEADLAAYLAHELPRTGRGVVVANPIPPEHELPAATFATWLAHAEAEAAAHRAEGRDVTPAVLGALHRLSGGATLRANVELVKHNAAVAAKLAVGMVR